MAFKTRVAGTTTTTARITAQVANQPRVAKKVSVWRSGALRLVQDFRTAESLNVAIAPSPLSKTGTTETVTSDPAAATVANGTSPFTYAWSMIAGDTGIAIQSPSLASTRFSKALFLDDAATGTAQVTVTDANGLTGSASVTVTLIRSGGGA